MATTYSDSMSFSSASRRKKPITYGRASRNKAFTPQSVGSFYEKGNATTSKDSTRDDDSNDDSNDDDESTDNDRTPSSHATRPIIRSTATDLPMRKSELLRQSSLIKKPSSAYNSQSSKHDISLDEFDVPLSDEEQTPVRLPPRQVSSNKTRVPKQTAQDGVASGAQQKEHKRKSPINAPASKRVRTSSPDSPPETAFVKLHEHSRTKTPTPQTHHNGKANPRRTTREAARNASILAGYSAPARLDAMISESSLEDAASPPATPPSRPALKRNASTTPKQSQLWSQLLSSDPVEPDCDISSHASVPAKPFDAKSKRASVNRSILKNKTPSVPPSSRLVDRLKQTATPLSQSDSEEDDSEEGDDTLTTLDLQSTEADQPLAKDSIPAGSTQPQLPESQKTDSQNSSGTRMTYARMRSYMYEDSLEESLMQSLALPTMPTSRPPAASRRQPLAGKSKSKSNTSIDSDSDDAGTTGIRSIHELRAAGNKNRFLDDNAALFDDIKDHKPASRSRRRSALIELANKFLDKTFLARFLEHGFDRELTAEVSPPYPDPVADVILCTIVAQLSGVDNKTTTRLYKAGAMGLAQRCVEENKTASQLARERSNNMSKVAQSTFLELMEALRTSTIWSDSQPEELTPRLIGLKCMQLIMLDLRRHNDEGSSLDASTIAILVNLATNIDGSASAPPSKSIAADLTLSVMEFASASSALAAVWSIDLWQQIVTALPVLLQLQGQAHALVLKICINLTNHKPQNCIACSDVKVITVIMRNIVSGFQVLHDELDEEEHIARLNSLILSLGLMINLAEFSDEACEQVVALQGSDGLSSLVAIFLRGQAKVEEAQSEQETQSNVAYGFLAVLLGNICQNDTARNEVRAYFPDRKLQPLLLAIDEFADHNRKVDSQAQENDEGHEVWRDFTGRLMAIVSCLRHLDE
ncbi:hypothetical protein AAFC00_002950 [Neodothiora populina]|uniref:Wings apart-like protein C-terminal domain-containing protein n=1 Tax=Neodothiora populina TaxID=2781224 RepID=A0ABR3P965_9PEZI